MLLLVAVVVAAVTLGSVLRSAGKPLDDTALYMARVPISAPATCSNAKKTLREIPKSYRTLRRVALDMERKKCR
jgi:hypothetical protein